MTTTTADSNNVDPGLLLSINRHPMRVALDNAARSGTYLLAAASSTARGRVFTSCLLFVDVTNAGFYQAVLSEPRFSVQVGRDLVLAIRRSSGLTWAELANVVAVDRRSLHLWARGSRPSEENYRRLQQVATLVQSLDAGSPTATRDRLMDAPEGGVSVFDLLQRGSSAKKPKAMQLKSRIPKGTFARERGSGPTQRLGALHDQVRVSGGKLRSVKPLRNRQG